MKTKIANLIILLALSYGVVAQQTPVSFTIGEAKAYALENNKTFQNAEADVNLANAQVKEAWSAGLPQVDGILDYMTYFGYELEFNFGGESTDPPEIDYSKLDPGDFEVLKILEGMSAGAGASTIKMTDQASANLQVSQLIFSGQYWMGIEMAKLGKKIREKSLNATALEVKEQVVNSYYLILVTKELLRVINENENNLKEIYQHTQNFYDAGMAEITDVDQIRINIAQLANSRRAMERNLELNYNMFRMVLGLEPGTPVELKDDLTDIVEESNRSQWIRNTFDPEKNPGYQIIATQEEISEKNISMHKWAYAPSLAGYYNYKEKILTSGFDMSPNHAAGLTMNIPIFSGGTRTAQLTQAKIELDKASRTKALLEEQLTLQNNQLLFDLTSATENYQTQSENVEVAQRVFDSMKNKYEEGTISSLDLTQANSNYLQAENNYISSILQLLQAQLALAKLNNNL